MTTKDQLTGRKRGKGGTLVRYTGADDGPMWLAPDEVYVVKDLMARKSWNKPNRVRIGPLDRGWAIGVQLDPVP